MYCDGIKLISVVTSTLFEIELLQIPEH